MVQTPMVPHESGTSQTNEQIESQAHHVLAQMSLEEKIQQMSGDTPRFTGILEMVRRYNEHPLPAGENTRLGLFGIRFSDGPRGVVMYHSTCFPVSMARGATWDPELEERVGDAIGVEARSQGSNFFGGVCINLLRHPAWGRAQETYGEDSFHLGEMGAALVRGVQRHIMACVKHYAANSIENSRFKVDVLIDERTLHEVYLPHFKRCIDEGAASVMSAYNKVNGSYCGHHHELLRTILKDLWQFDGFVISDFMYGIRDAAAAANAGMDIEMPFQWHYRGKLKQLVEEGKVPLAVIDDAVLRIVRQQLRFAQIGEPVRYGQHTVANQEHRALAREVAQKSMVLLKNDETVSGQRLLPIDLTTTRRIALIGSLSTKANIGDHGSSRVRAPYVITPYQGLRAALTDDVEIDCYDGTNIHTATDMAAKANCAVVVVGYSHNDEGEYLGFLGGGDRISLRLSAQEEALIHAVVRTNPNTIVVLIGGSAIITETWRTKVPAIVMAWYPGMEGGHAIADILCGKVNPSGKLPCIFPASEEHLPYFDSQTESIEYGYYHGYKLADKYQYQPAFPFGFGLSYTTYTYTNLAIQNDELHMGDTLSVSMDVTNTGNRAGEEIVQMYIGYEDSAVDRPQKELRGFQRIQIKAGATERVTLSVPIQQLAYYDPNRKDWVVEPITYNVYVGPSSSDADLLRGRFQVKA
ncbi:MAG: glycoside hydrolase family 3 C-terminal domain-containing protein [Chloroflexota bacterium]